MKRRRSAYGRDGREAFTGKVYLFLEGEPRVF